MHGWIERSLSHCRKASLSIALVADQLSARDLRQGLLGSRNIGFLASPKQQGGRRSGFIDRRVKLRVESAFGRSHGLMFPASRRIAAAAVNFDKGRVQEAPLAFEFRCALVKQLNPDSLPTPSPPVIIDGVPVRLATVNRPP